MSELKELPRLTLGDVRTALKELHEGDGEITDVEALYALTKNKRQLAMQIAGNTELSEKFGDERQITEGLDKLKTLYEDEIRTIEASVDFAREAEKQPWGKWAIDKVKSSASFAGKHWIVSLLLLSVVAGGVLGYLGYLPTLSLPFAGWLQKLKALMSGVPGFGGLAGGEAAAEGAAVAEGVAEATEGGSLLFRTIGRSVEYAGKLYGIEDLPALVDSLPAELEPGQLLKILRDNSSRAGVEEELKSLLLKKFGDESLFDWADQMPAN